MKRFGPNSDQTDLPSGTSTIAANPTFGGTSIYITPTPPIPTGSIIVASLEDASNTVALGDLTAKGYWAPNGALNIAVSANTNPYNLTHSITVNWIAFPPKM